MKRLSGREALKLRKKRRMSQQEVASALGNDAADRFQLGMRSGCSRLLDKAADLARLYGVSLDDLVAERRFEVVVADPDQAGTRASRSQPACAPPSGRQKPMPHLLSVYA